MTTRLCPECRVDKHPNCTGISFDENDQEQQCPCYLCYPPKPERCPACGAHINPSTGECRCSD